MAISRGDFGVADLSSFKGSAPCLRSSSTISLSPRLTASCSGVVPYAFIEFTLAPASEIGMRLKSVKSVLHLEEKTS